MLIPLKPGDIFAGHYRLLKPLSTAGASADVWLAADLNTIDDPIESRDNLGEAKPDEATAMQVAIKIYRPQNALDIEGEQRFRDEFKIVYNCHHSNLIQPTHFDITGETPYLVMPYCSRGSSETLAGRLTAADDIWKYIGDVAAGLAYLHAMEPPIVHQDIKPANVLIDDSGNYAITDFGISVTRDRYQQHDFSGTRAYMPPERFGNDKPQPASDIYAFGITLFELITGQVPFGESGGQQQPDGMVKLNFMGRDVPASIAKLIAACLDRDPARRPTAEQLVLAAQQHVFPPKPSRTHLWATLAIAAVVVAAAAIALLVHRGNATSVAEPVDTVALFQRALQLASSTDPVQAHDGMKMMDSVARMFNYIPAYYEIARTYGVDYTKDSDIYNPRKRTLGIAMGNENARKNLARLGLPTDIAATFPASDNNITRANDALMKILEIGDKQTALGTNDSTLMTHMTQAAQELARYRLLCFSNDAEALDFFKRARNLAQHTHDTTTAKNAEAFIQLIESKNTSLPK